MSWSDKEVNVVKFMFNDVRLDPHQTVPNEKQKFGGKLIYFYSN